MLFLDTITKCVPVITGKRRYIPKISIVDAGKFPPSLNLDLNPWQAVTDHPYICGQFLWTGIDYLGEARGWTAPLTTCF